MRYVVGFADIKDMFLNVQSFVINTRLILICERSPASYYQSLKVLKKVKEGQIGKKSRERLKSHVMGETEILITRFYHKRLEKPVHFKTSHLT